MLNMIFDFLISFIFFVFSFPFGYLFLRKLFLEKHINIFETFLFSEILGITISSLFIFILNFYISTFISVVVVCTFSLTLLTFFILRDLFLKELLVKLKINKFSCLLFLFNIFWLIIISWIIFQTHLKPIGDTLNGSPSTFGDLPFHLGLISNFAYGNNFPPVNPIAPFMHLSYHFIADYLSALLLVLGSSLRGAIIFPSIFLGILIVNSIYLLSFKITKSRSVSIITPFIFLFNGGIGFLKIFETLFQGQFTPSILFNGTIRFAHIPELGVEFPNILTELMMAERALLIGIPLWITSIFFLYIWYKKNDKKSLYLAGMATGLLPYANIYGFLVNAFIFLFLFISIFFSNRRRINLVQWLTLGIEILLISLPFFLLIISQTTTKSSFIRISLFEWPPMDGPFKLTFWLSNFGLVPIMALIVFCFKGILPKQNKLFLGLISVVILIGHVVVFQPYAWDNNRFVLYPYIAISILASCLIVYIIKIPKGIVRIIGILIFGFSITTGLLVSINDPNIHYALFAKQDMMLALKIRELTDPHGIFLSARNHNNIISSLAGRRIYLGYGGYLWTQGINNTQRMEEIMTDVYACKGNILQLVARENIRYIVLSGWERREYPNIDILCLEKTFKGIINYNGYEILDTKNVERNY